MEKLVQGHPPAGRRRGRSHTRYVDTTTHILDISVRVSKLSNWLTMVIGGELELGKQSPTSQHAW